MLCNGDQYELALTALCVSVGNRTAALRILRDECDMPLKDGVYAINAWERLYKPARAAK